MDRRMTVLSGTAAINWALAARKDAACAGPSAFDQGAEEHGQLQRQS
jgi:hypothetical protein